MHTAFHVDMLDVGLERARSDKQLAFDLGVRLPPGDEAHDLVLSGTEVAGGRHGVAVFGDLLRFEALRS